VDFELSILRYASRGRIFRESKTATQGFRVLTCLWSQKIKWSKKRKGSRRGEEVLVFKLRGRGELDYVSNQSP